MPRTVLAASATAFSAALAKLSLEEPHNVDDFLGHGCLLTSNRSISLPKGESRNQKEPAVRQAGVPEFNPPYTIVK
jgi:hypothetical protein